MSPIRLKDSAEARFWVPHTCAVLGAFLLGYLVGPRLAPFFSLLACRPFVAIVLTLLPTGRERSYRPHLLGGALALAALAHIVPARGTAVYLMVMAYVLMLDLVVDALVVRCCPEDEWVGKTAGLGLARAVGLLAGLVVSGLNWVSAPWCVALPLLGIAALWIVCGEGKEAGPQDQTPGIGLVVDSFRTWMTCWSVWESSLLLVAVALLAGIAGTTLFPLVVLAPATIADWLADPWTWLGSGVLWVLLAWVLERLSLPSLVWAIMPLGVAGVWLAGPSGVWPLGLQLVLGLAALTAYRGVLAAQGKAVDPVLRTAIPLTLWALGQLGGETLVSRWPGLVVPVKVLASLILMAALWPAYRRWSPRVRISSSEVERSERESGSERHGDRTFDFEAAPAMRPKKRSRWLARLWYLLGVRFPVTITITLLGAFLLAGLWHLSAQRGTWRAKAENSWLSFQTELFVSRLKVRLEEEMLASNRVPRDWAGFIGSSFQLNGRPMKDRDFWGTPLHFESLPKEVLIVSAGADRKLFTRDDISRRAQKPQGVK